MKSNSPEEIFAQYCTAGKVAFLIGAGLSMPEPTCLPSGPRLLKSFILRVIEGGSPFLAFSLTEQLTQLLPELGFQLAFEVIGDKIWRFFDELNGKAPNKAHSALADLICSLRSPCFTTNFDTLIESCGAQSSGVVHLHGSLEQVDSITATLDRIYFARTTSALQSLSALTSDYALIVMGYSGADQDVMDAVRYSGVANIIWLTYPKDVTDETAIRHRCGVKQVRFVSGDVMDVLPALASNLRCNSFCSVASWPERKMPGSFSVQPEEAFAILVRVATWLRLFELAIDLSMKALDRLPFGQSTNLWTTTGFFKSSIIEAKRGLGDYDEVVAMSTTFTSELLNEEQPHWAAMCMNSQALVYGEDKDLERYGKGAESLYRNALQSLSLSPTAISKRAIPRIHNNLSLLYRRLGNLDSAATELRASIRLKRKLGDLPGLAQSASNLAIVELYRGRKRAYRYWSRVAGDLADFIRSELIPNEMEYRLGHYYFEMKAFAVARRHFLRARPFYRSFPDKRFAISIQLRLSEMFPGSF